MSRRIGAIASLVVPVLAVVAALGVVAAREDGPPDAQTRVERLARELRCPECTSQSVADSAASTARDMRAEVERRVTAGESDDEIRDAFVERYGEWVMLAPPRDGIGLVVWLAPVLVVVGGAVGLVLVIGRRRREVSVPSARDEELVRRARGTGGPG